MEEVGVGVWGGGYVHIVLDVVACVVWNSIAIEIHSP